jgi:hypothetical protein
MIDDPVMEKTWTRRNEPVPDRTRRWLVRQAAATRYGWSYASPAQASCYAAADAAALIVVAGSAPRPHSPHNLLVSMGLKRLRRRKCRVNIHPRRPRKGSAPMKQASRVLIRRFLRRGVLLPPRTREIPGSVASNRVTAGTHLLHKAHGVTRTIRRPDYLPPRRLCRHPSSGRRGRFAIDDVWRLQSGV